MKQQDILRKQVKLAKACTDWLTFKDLAATLDITDHSFYNWLNGYYELSSKKAAQLQELIIDLIDMD